MSWQSLDLGDGTSSPGSFKQNCCIKPPSFNEEGTANPKEPGVPILTTSCGAFPCAGGFQGGKEGRKEGSVIKVNQLIAVLPMETSFEEHIIPRTEHKNVDLLQKLLVQQQIISLPSKEQILLFPLPSPYSCTPRQTLTFSYPSTIPTQPWMGTVGTLPFHLEQWGSGGVNNRGQNKTSCTQQI